MTFPRPNLPSRLGSRSGFTLVEILVVIAIIALLAGVALPAVTGALKKARESAAVQGGHGLALAEFQFAADNNGVYPGKTAALAVAGSSSAVTLALYPTYLSSTDTLAVTGGAVTSKWPGTGALDATHNAWDLVFRDATFDGLTSGDPDSMPVALTTGYTIGSYGTATTGGTPVTATLTAAVAAPFGADGIAVGFKDMSSAFISSTTNGGAAGTYNLTSGAIEPPLGYAYAQGLPAN